MPGGSLFRKNLVEDIIEKVNEKQILEINEAKRMFIIIAKHGLKYREHYLICSYCDIPYKTIEKIKNCIDGYYCRNMCGREFCKPRKFCKNCKKTLCLSCYVTCSKPDCGKSYCRSYNCFGVMCSCSSYFCYEHKDCCYEDYIDKQCINCENDFKLDYDSN